MAIELECIDFLVPIKVIQAKYPGGWEQCLRDHSDSLGGRVWYDDHLFRDGAMSPNSIEILIHEWTERGFQDEVVRDGRHYWQDFCVPDYSIGDEPMLCDWLVVDLGGRRAYLRDTHPGVRVHRTNFEEWKAQSRQWALNLS